MRARRLATWALASSLGAAAVWAAVSARAGAEPKLDVEQVLQRSAAARGGLDAWAKVQTMAWTGHVEPAGGSGPQAQFMLQQKRPNLMRYELVAGGQRSVRVFDGEQGWKLRSSQGGRPDVQPYEDEELRAARDALVIDGPVLNARARGVELGLQGIEEIEGRPAYRLVAKLPSGTEQHVWIDAKSFLEVKYDRPGRDATGRPTTVAMYLRNYRAFDGLQIPLTIETGMPGGGPGGDRLVIERIAINPNLPPGAFARPGAHISRRGVTVDTRAAAGRPGQPTGWSPVRAPSTPASGAVGTGEPAP